ncbi:PE family protein [Mycobacterium gordonae]|uniref:PE domain-containing protein n=1 Tax=Mycobacterium gordonae TaxID=1778 RepID=A0A1X1V929_MYCGO|nr:PE family protein [Mycobacterium gordonae]ODR18925.1 hypothetical protein BHQ23_21260 [Mycobacterium gordonae]ORV65583.1 hypothetical protein AWC08_10665 [Mycobacterium gordonae]
MPHVNVTPHALNAAANDLAAISSNVHGANKAAASPTTGLSPAGADPVSALIAGLFTQHAQSYQAVGAHAATFHDKFVEIMREGAGSYTNTEAANALPIEHLRDAVSTAAQSPTGRGLIDGANRAVTAGKDAAGHLFGNDGTGSGGWGVAGQGGGNSANPGLPGAAANGSGSAGASGGSNAGPAAAVGGAHGGNGGAAPPGGVQGTGGDLGGHGTTTGSGGGTQPGGGGSTGGAGGSGGSGGGSADSGPGTAGGSSVSPPGWAGGAGAGPYYGGAAAGIGPAGWPFGGGPLGAGPAWTAGFSGDSGAVSGMATPAGAAASMPSTAPAAAEPALPTASRAAAMPLGQMAPQGNSVRADPAAHPAGPDADKSLLIVPLPRLRLRGLRERLRARSELRDGSDSELRAGSEFFQRSREAQFTQLSSRDQLLQALGLRVPAYE